MQIYSIPLNTSSLAFVLIIDSVWAQEALLIRRYAVECEKQIATGIENVGYRAQFTEAYHMLDSVSKAKNP